VDIVIGTRTNQARSGEAQGDLPVSGSIIFICGSPALGKVGEDLQVAARFYGLDIKSFALQTETARSQALQALAEIYFLGVVLSADALPSLSPSTVIPLLKRKDGKRTPVLILNVSTDTDPECLKSWSESRDFQCIGPHRITAKAGYGVADISRLTYELGGQTLPAVDALAYSFNSTGIERIQEIIAVRAEDRKLPLFLRCDAWEGDAFFLAATNCLSMEVKPEREDLLSVFQRFAPLLIFLRYCAGPHAWHPVAQYANLTIDDPWLIEPFGHLYYKKLLGEMENVNFHTTIGFIPWNFDRSRSDVSALIRNNPGRFSVCLHGNNHDHDEFTDLQDKSFDLQCDDIRQALARMERFSELTGIPYDRVMVHPHDEMAPERTLEAFKAYNFLGAVACVNVPRDVAWPEDPLFKLLPATLSFGNLPLLRRYSVDCMPSELKSYIAIKLFLGMPLLFYCHHDFFMSGANAFSDVAKFVNKTQPYTRWGSLSSVFEHLYHVRRREDGDYDMKVFSSKIRLRNPSEHDITYHVEKYENGSPPIASLTIDGQSHPYNLSDGYLKIAVRVPARGTRCLAVDYANDLRFQTTDVSKRSPSIAVLRRLSDCRDLMLSRHVLGRAAIRSFKIAQRVSGSVRAMLSGRPPVH